MSIARNKLTGLYWNGFFFMGKNRSEAALLDSVTVAVIKYTYLNVEIISI